MGLLDNPDLNALMAGFNPTDEDKKRALYQSLLSAGLGMLGARKGQELQQFGNAGLLGMNTYNSALQQGRQQAMQNIQARGAGLGLLNQNMQYEDQNLLRQQQLDFAKRFGGATGQTPPQAQQPAFGMNDRSAGTALPQGSPMPQGMPQAAPQAAPQTAPMPQQGAPGVPSKRDVAGQYQQYGDYWMANGRPDQAQKYYDLAQKAVPQIKEQKTLTQNGKRVVVNVYTDGSTEVLPDVGPDMEKAHFADTGNVAGIPLDPFTGTPLGKGLAKSVSPDAQLSSQTAARGQDITLRGQNLTDSRDRERLNIERVNADPLGMLGLNKAGAAAQTPATAALAQDVHGQDFLKGLPQPIGDQVKALAEGRLAFPAGFALKSPYWQTMISLVSQYDPNFDAVNYGSRASTRKSFTSGPAAQNIVALNTGMDHLMSLRDSLSSLNNFGGMGTPLNAPINAVQEAFGDPRQKRVQMDTQAVSHELAKVFRQSGMSEREVAQWENSVSRNMSPDQQQAALSEAVKLMNGRLDALGQQYGQGMGTTTNGIELLSPKAQASYKTLTQGTQPKKKQGWSATEIK